MSISSSIREENGDVRHPVPKDTHNVVRWLFEPPTMDGVLTQDGITQIAHHKYTGGQYTIFDTFLNPVWQSLTDLLPMTMAPNLVTAIGGLHCFAAYMLTWWYNPNLDSQVPSWILVVNGLATFIYYTLDCMDGKQARRTGSSSPLGQLFDHGVDCLTSHFHVSAFQSWALMPHTTLIRMQQYMLFTFFVAQWEEYYTGVLPHATGDVGVTEVIYGCGVLSLVHALVDREALYSTPFESLLPSSVAKSGFLSRVNAVFIGPMFGITTDRMELRHGLGVIWDIGQTLLVVLSFSRVLKHLRKTPERQLVAAAKLLNPAMLALSPLFLPTDALERDYRYVALGAGLALCFASIKLIVFSMAKQTYAIFQLDTLPVFAAIAWIIYDRRLTEKGTRLLWQCLCAWYLYRLHSWTSTASAQICQRMKIHMFSIVKKD